MRFAFYLLAGLAAGCLPGISSPALAAKPVKPRGAALRPAARRKAAPLPQLTKVCSIRTPDSSGFCSAARSPHTDELEKAALEIPTLKTGEEVATVVAALQKVRGVKSAIIDLNTRLGVVDYDPALATLPLLLTTCKDAGFEANEYRVEVRFPKPIKLKGG